MTANAMFDSTERRAAVWLLSGDAGLSSRTVCAFFLGVPHRCDHPWDDDDFGRCLRLLRAMPEWRLRVSELAVLSPEWAALAGAWDELERLYLADSRVGGVARPCYARIRALIDGARAKGGAAS